MLRLIAALQLRPTEPSVRALALSAMQHTQTRLHSACFDARAQGCDETTLAQRVEENRKKPKTSSSTNAQPNRLPKAKAAPAVDDTPARLRFALTTYCDAAIVGGYAYEAIFKGRPKGALSIAQIYWNGAVPAAIANTGASILAESGACTADPIWKELEDEGQGTNQKKTKDKKP